jgi:hypothetical protein
MNMQDKEMDQLFRAKLDNYEIEPSANVWANISSELNQTSTRKSYVPLLRIAASIVILVSAGLFFLPKKQAVTNPPKNNKLAMNPVVKPATTVQPSVNQQTVNQVAPVQPVTNVQPKQQIAAVSHHATVQQSTTIITKPEVAVVPQVTPVNNNQQLIAAVDNNKNTVTNHEVPEGPIKLIPAEDTHDFITKSANAILASNPTDAGSEAKPVQKHKAHGLGGLLNKVIAAVDKRDDKIIEFTDTDEGDSITGINLGIIKVKKVK